MEVFLFDNEKSRLVLAEIMLAERKDLPLKKNGWNFNWKTAFKIKDSQVYALRVKGSDSKLEGLVQLSEIEGMLFMNLLELAPQNVGRGSKKFEHVAGCLISFCCYKSFSLKTIYRGFVSFETKTSLRSWYKENYYAEDAMGSKMFIWPDDGLQLINEFLNRKS